MFAGQIIRKNNSSKWDSADKNLLIIVRTDGYSFDYRYTLEGIHSVGHNWIVEHFSMYFEEV